MNLTDPPFGSPSPPGMAQAEWSARQDLALAYRLFDQFGWHELIYNHITVRVPDEEGRFLINPFGLMYREITASNLVKIDVDGRVLSTPSSRINPAGFVVHAAVHACRADAHAVIHSHTTAGQAVSCQRQGLLPLSFSSVFFHERIAYHDFEGITLDRDECGRLAQDLGSSNVMILRNHGLLTCGPYPGARIQSALPVAACMRGTDRSASRRGRHQAGTGEHCVPRCRAVCCSPDPWRRRRDAL